MLDGRRWFFMVVPCNAFPPRPTSRHFPHFCPRAASVACLVATAVGCASSGGAGASDEEVLAVDARDYAPLAVGARWTYETNVLGDRTKGTVDIQIVDKADGYYRDTARAEYRHTANGLRDRVRYLIRNPLKPGRKWKATVSASAVEHYTIESVGQPCDTKAGTFPDCLVVSAYQRRNRREVQHVTYTWVRSVGLAKVLVEGEIAGKGRFLQSELSLVQYSLTGGLDEIDEDGAPSEWHR